MTNILLTIQSFTMPLILAYLLKLSLSLTIVFLFYQFVLRKLTFYNWNRWYLLGYTMMSFFIAFIDISPVLQRNEWTHNTIVTWVPVITGNNITTSGPASSFQFFTTWNIMSFLVVTGMLIMFMRLLIQLMSFRKMIKRAKAIHVEGMKLFQVDEKIIPFSFGNSIFINQHLHSNEELQQIIRHEFVHVKQVHSVDIIWGELLCLFNWYSPFAWLLKRSIRQNLEFIADNQVLQNGINKKHYQYLLLKVIGNNQFSIAPKFNFSSLKKRIAMMNKLKSARLHLVRFLFILPLLGIILLSFRKQIGMSFKQDKNKIAGITQSDFTDTVPEVIELNDKGFFIDIKGKNADCFVVVKDKTAKEVTRVLLTKWKENEEYYEKLYGEILPPPPPEPPMPPTPPVPPVNINDDPAVKAFLKRNPDVKHIGWVYINVRENLLAIAVITKKNGTIEEYDLRKESDKTNAEKKYGELPYPPATPPQPIVALPVMPDFVKKFKGNAEYVEIWLNDGTKESYKLTNASEKAAFEKKYGKLMEQPVELDPLEPAEVVELRELGELAPLPVGTDIEITETAAIVKLNNGKIEKYNIKDPRQKAQFEKKYGKIIMRPGGNNSVELSEVIEVPVTTGDNVHSRTLITPLAPLSEDNGLTAPVIVGDNGDIVEGKEDLLITITRKTTRDELEEFKKQMKLKGIELTFEEIQYNEKGILTTITGTLKSKEGQSNFVAVDFNKLMLAMIKSGSRTFFKVHVTDRRAEI